MIGLNGEFLNIWMIDNPQVYLINIHKIKKFNH